MMGWIRFYPTQIDIGYWIVVGLEDKSLQLSIEVSELR